MPRDHRSESTTAQGASPPPPPPTRHLILDAVGTPALGGGAQVLSGLLGALRPHLQQGLMQVTLLTHLPPHVLSLPAGVVHRQVAWAKGHAWRVAWVCGGLALEAWRLGGDGVILTTGLGLIPGLPTFALVQQGLWFAPTSLWPPSMRHVLPVTRLLAKRSCAQACHVVVQGDHMAGLVATHFGIPAARILVCPPTPPTPTSQAQGPRDEGPFRLFYPGHTLPYRQVPLVCEVVRRLRGAGREVEVRLTCEGRSEPGIVCLGAMPHEAVMAQWGQTDALLHPSLCETVGLGMLEAAASGVPVIAPELPYTRAIAPWAMRIPEALSVSAWMKGLERLIDDQALWHEFSGRGVRMGGVGGGMELLAATVLQALQAG